MRIKRFQGKDSKSALALVKNEMGDDAIILATKTIGKKGSERCIEVVAAMDYDLDNLLEVADDKHTKPAASPPSYGYQTLRSKTPLNSDNSKTIEAPTNEKINSETHDLRLRFANIFRHSNNNKYQSTKPASQPATSARGKHPPSPTEVENWRNKLVDQIKLPQVQVPTDKFQEIIALVGSTGVGKTTTAAKLAAWHSLRCGQRVALISMDCYRIGATDQLRTYANIMRLPCEIVLRKSDMPRALSRQQDKDVIIIDTAGKSPYDEKHIKELNDWFAISTEIKPHLVLSAITKKEDLSAIVHVYNSLNINSIILTKLDETRAYAALCQQIVASALPVSYLSIGQRVPEDFLAASKDFLDRLFKQGWQAAAHTIDISDYERK